MRNPIQSFAPRDDAEQRQVSSTPADEGSHHQKPEIQPRLCRSGRLREATLSNRELKAGMIRILGAAKAATYLGLIRKDSVMRQEMLRLVVAHSIP